MPARIRLPRLRSILLALVVAAAALLVVVGSAFLVDTAGPDRTIRGLEVERRDVGDLARPDLETALADVALEVESVPVRIDLPDGPRVLPAGELGVTLDVEETADRALEAGHESGLRGFVTWLDSFTNGRSVPIALAYDDSVAARTVATFDGLIVSRPVEPQLVLAADGVLTVEPGSPGRQVDATAIVERLGHQVEAGGPFSVDAPTLPVPPRTPDEDVEELATRLNDLTEGGVRISIGEEERSISQAALRTRLRTDAAGGGPEERFDLDSLRRLIEQLFSNLDQGGTDPTFDVVDGEPVVVEEGTVPLECCAEGAARTVAAAVLEGRPGPIELEPRPSRDERLAAWAAGSEVVELVSEFTTYHSCCETRVENIQRFADIVRGVYLVPGESLSLNEHVGERTVEKGFQPAGTIIRGRLVPTVGGGVSQFATTIFNAAFFAGFDFETYQSHSIYFSRYPYGREATISWPAPDLEFTNTTSHPALIWTSYTDTSITVSVYSTQSVQVEETGQEVSSVRQCTRVDTFRSRTYPDGRTVEDSVFAVYRPGEGLDCNGDPTPTT